MKMGLMTLAAVAVLVDGFALGQSVAQVNSTKPVDTPSQTANVVHTQEYDVKVLRVVAAEVSESGSPVHLVEYEYEFRGRSQVNIRGLGDVSAKGRLEYFTFDPHIEFRDAVAGKTIAIVPLQETIVFGGPGLTVDFPKDTELSPTIREGVWTEPMSSFHDNATRVLARYFPSGIAAQEQDKVESYKTQYKQMDGLRDHNVIGEVAVLVSHPFRTEKARFYFHVQYAVRESRTKSPEFHPASREVITAAEDLIDRLIKELQKTGSAQQ